ncbi:MAG: DNA repair protein RecO [Patescibacteria group bacterium]
MYHKIATDGIVLRKRGVGEANLRVAILTREAGLVVASARSARYEKATMRYGLEPLTVARFCFVRGQHEWRVTEAHLPHRLGGTPAERAAIARISQLLLRLIHGQEPHAKLFEDIKSGFEAFESQDIASVETVLVLRILSHLGYLPQTDALAPYVEGEFGIELSAKALKERSLLVRAINESLKATGL